MDNYFLRLKSRYSDVNQEVKHLRNSRKKYEDMVRNLKNIRDKLTIELMSPVPTSNSPLAFLESIAVHTNELYLPVGNTYYVKGTAQHAMDFCLRRCADIDQKIDELSKEQKQLLERISLLQLDSESNFGQSEIIETYNESEERKWREQHQVHVRKMKEKEAEERKLIDKPAEHYFARLEQLELEEQFADSMTIAET